jgi:hypothetical protein
MTSVADIDTAPVLASARPFKVPPPRVTDVWARIFPTVTEPGPTDVNELPATQ